MLSLPPATEPTPAERSRLFDRLDRIMIALAGLILAAMAVLMNVEVFSRTLLSRSTHVSDEFAGYGLCAVTMLCLVAAMRRGRFLRVDGIIERLPPRGQAAAEIFGAIIGLAVSLVLCWSTGKLAWTSYVFGTRSIEMSQTPLVAPQILMPLGFGLLALAFIEMVLRRYAGLLPPRGKLGR